MNEIERDANGVPLLRRVGAAITQLERMADFRQQAVQSRNESPGVLGYYTKEVRALEMAITALTYHRAVVQGLPEPLKLLRQMVAALPPDIESAELRALRKQAADVLAEFERADRG